MTLSDLRRDAENLAAHFNSNRYSVKVSGSKRTKGADFEGRKTSLKEVWMSVECDPASFDFIAGLFDRWFMGCVVKFTKFEDERRMNVWIRSWL
jgi:hypothetical protein